MSCENCEAVVRLGAQILPLRRAARGECSVLQTRDSRTEVSVRRIPELNDQRMPLERLLDAPALNALAATVNQANLTQATFVRRVHERFDHRLHIAGREWVQIERVFNWDPVRHKPQLFASYDAVTIVLMPPRTLKSPTTVMRRG